MSSDGEASGVTQADFLMPEEKTVVMLSTKGDLGRTHGDDPPKITTGTKQPPRLLQHSTTAQILYLFAHDGHCATLPVQQLPQVKQAAEGMPYSALTDLGQKRKIVSFLCLPTELQTGMSACSLRRVRSNACIYWTCRASCRMNSA